MRASRLPLGLEKPAFFDGERAEQIRYLRFPLVGSGSIGLRQAREPQAFELYAPGLHHVALVVETRADVDTAHTAAVEAWTEVLHAPRPWPQYHPEDYATFFLDPDGWFLTAIILSRFLPGVRTGLSTAFSRPALRNWMLFWFGTAHSPQRLTPLLPSTSIYCLGGWL